MCVCIHPIRLFLCITSDSKSSAFKMETENPINILSFLDHFQYAAAPAKSRQSYPTLCDPIDGSPPGSTIPGILQAGTVEWVAISFSNA